MENILEVSINVRTIMTFFIKNLEIFLELSNLWLTL